MFNCSSRFLNEITACKMCLYSYGKNLILIKILNCSYSKNRNILFYFILLYNVIRFVNYTIFYAIFRCYRRRISQRTRCYFIIPVIYHFISCGSGISTHYYTFFAESIIGCKLSIHICFNFLIKEIILYTIILIIQKSRTKFIVLLPH